MNGKQLGFADHEQSMAKKRTKRERFLSEMEAVVPWKALIDLIEPHYPKTSSKGGLPPYPLGTMLRIHPGRLKLCPMRPLRICQHGIGSAGMVVLHAQNPERRNGTKRSERSDQLPQGPSQTVASPVGCAIRSGFCCC